VLKGIHQKFPVVDDFGTLKNVIDQCYFALYNPLSIVRHKMLWNMSKIRYFATV
jgi:hypothetical protein